MVGITSPLTPGNYEVDFYLDKGAGIDASKPDQFRAWTIAAPPPTPTPTTSPTPPPVTGVTPLPPAYLGSSAWGVDAPDDNDQAAWVNSGFTAGGSDGSRGYSEKGYAYVLNNLSQLPTISNSANGGGTRFGPVTVDGLPAILHNVRQGDALRYQGNRSGIVYGGYAIQHGEDHWFAWAFKLGTEWQVANSGGHGDRNGLFDTHQQTATIGNPSGLNWWGDSPAGHELWWYVERMDGSGSAFLYNAPAAPGQWQRCIIHYRSGSLAQGPVYDVWFATGTAAYVKLPRAIDPYTGTQWTTVPAFGDITNNLTGQVDYPKLEFYKWTHDIYGNMPNRNYWTSGLFAAPGLDNYDAAVAALAPYAK